MKIIDLLNKIANGEEVPKKIKYKDWLYDWNELAKDYECGNDWLEERICDDFKIFLNDEIEIIKEDKEIEELPNVFGIDDCEDIKELSEEVERRYNEIADKINELIDKVNSLENKQ